MKKCITISIGTKSEIIDWRVGERLIDSLNLYGELLVPEQVSPNADKFIDPYMGKAASEGAMGIARDYAIQWGVAVA
ncbi:hypothetical protein GCM10027202_16630 [Microvirgula curvata]